jgi:hypothetical protein
MIEPKLIKYFFNTLTGRSELEAPNDEEAMFYLKSKYGPFLGSVQYVYTNKENSENSEYSEYRTIWIR